MRLTSYKIKTGVRETAGASLLSSVKKMAGFMFISVFLCGWIYVELSRRCLSSKFRSKSLHNKKSNDALQHINVIIPDMFQTFLKLPPKVNPYYKEVKSESEEWLSRFAKSLHCTSAIVNVNTASARMEKRQKMLCTGVTSHTLFLYPPLSPLRPSFEPSVIGVTGYVFHVSLTRSYPDIVAPQVFPFDDSKLCRLYIIPHSSLIVAVFDNGHLKDQPGQARQIMDSLMAAMDGTEHERKLKIVEAHDTVVRRIAAV